MEWLSVTGYWLPPLAMLPHFGVRVTVGLGKLMLIKYANTPPPGVAYASKSPPVRQSVSYNYFTFKTYVIYEYIWNSHFLFKYKPSNTAAQSTSGVCKATKKRHETSVASDILRLWLYGMLNVSKLPPPPALVNGKSPPNAPHLPYIARGGGSPGLQWVEHYVGSCWSRRGLKQRCVYHMAERFCVQTAVLYPLWL